MTVTYLPAGVLKGEVQLNFEYIENYAVFRDPKYGVVLDGNPQYAGPPTSGYWKAGASYIDSEGVQWICQTPGNPGTWVAVVMSGLGHSGTANNGGYTWGTSYNAFVSMSLTVKNPAGANVFVLGGFSSYVTASGYVACGMKVDSGAWTKQGGLYFNNTGVHQWCGTYPAIFTMAAGPHTVYVGGAEVVGPGGGSAATAASDANDNAWVIAWEMT